VRLISYDEQGVVELTGDLIDQPIEPRDYAIQLVLLSMLNTQTSNVVYPTWGGSLYEMTRRPKRRSIEETSVELSERLLRIREFVIGVDCGDGRHIISDVSLGAVTRDASGKLLFELKIAFEGAIPLEARTRGD